MDSVTHGSGERAACAGAADGETQRLSHNQPISIHTRKAQSDLKLTLPPAARSEIGTDRVHDRGDKIVSHQRCQFPRSLSAEKAYYPGVGFRKGLIDPGKWINGALTKQLQILLLRRCRGWSGRHDAQDSQLSRAPAWTYRSATRDDERSAKSPTATKSRALIRWSP